jgi:hypothetical protein
MKGSIVLEAYQGLKEVLITIHIYDIYSFIVKQADLEMYNLPLPVITILFCRYRLQVPVCVNKVTTILCVLI